MTRDVDTALADAQQRVTEAEVSRSDVKRIIDAFHETFVRRISPKADVR